MQHRILQMAILSAALLVGAGCNAGIPNRDNRTWSNASAVVVTSGDSVSVLFVCQGATFAPGSLPSSGGFTLRGTYRSLNSHDTLTVTGVVNGSSISFDVRPGITHGVEHYDLARDGVLPDWYPDKASCVV